MNSNSGAYQVGIVGGGPVGLFLACCLHRAGISCIVLDKKARPISHSRSIGIHPVSLNIFKKTSLAEAFVTAGIKVRRGQAFCNTQHVGTIDFGVCPPPYRFILTLPQFKTERILREHLCRLDKRIFQQNCRVNHINPTANGLELGINKNKQNYKINVSYVVGCDGINSFVRRKAGITFPGKAYDDAYIMGDFSRNTSLGDDAAIFLCDEGVIESFPLSKSMRRWVVKTRDYLPAADRAYIEKQVAGRIHHDLSDAQNKMLSSFGVQKKLAESMAKGRVILAGDAAHVVSPIGGQGMNLGWLDGWDLSRGLQQIFRGGADPRRVLASYSRRRRRVARKAARRAEFNMWMGRKTSAMFLRKALLNVALKPPISHLMARLFTMHGLESGLL